MNFIHQCRVIVKTEFSLSLNGSAVFAFSTLQHPFLSRTVALPSLSHGTKTLVSQNNNLSEKNAVEHFPALHILIV